MPTITIKLFRITPDFDIPLPTRATEGASGFDLRAAVRSPLRLLPGMIELVPTGVGLIIPPGLEGQVRPRSGLAIRHGITVLNSPGTIDSDYRGEIGVILVNHGQEPYIISRGERIAQLVIMPVMQVIWEEVFESQFVKTDRGPSGFGSTGSL